MTPPSDQTHRVSASRVASGDRSEGGVKHGGVIAAGWGQRLGQKIPKALTPVAGKPLIDYALDGLAAASVSDVTCIVNEAAREVPRYVARSRKSAAPSAIDWIVQTTPSSMHSFLIVLERLANRGTGPFLITTVDSVCAADSYAQFDSAARLFPDADVVLGLTGVNEDENPLRVALRGEEKTGIIPERIEDNPPAFEIVAMTNTGFDSTHVTSGFYFVKASILKEKDAALHQGFTALRQYLGHLLKYGYRFYGVPLPTVVDVDRPRDIRFAEELLCRP